MVLVVVLVLVLVRELDLMNSTVQYTPFSRQKERKGNPILKVQGTANYPKRGIVLLLYLLEIGNYNRVSQQ